MRRAGCCGSVLIISLSLVAVLSVLAVSVGRQLSLDVRLTKHRLARERAMALARSGVYLASERLARDAAESDGKVYDWLGDEWSGEWIAPAPNEAEIRVEISDEGRKLRLNDATREQLGRLTGDDTLAQAIVDARDEPDPAEDSPAGTPPYFAKNGPFTAPEELADLPGMTQERYEILEGHTSPYAAATEPLNLNTATPEVLRAAGLTENAVQLVLAYREGPDGTASHEQDGIFTESGLAILQTLKDAAGVDLTGTEDGSLLSSNLFGVASTVFTVAAEGVTARPAARARVAAVVRRAGCGEGRPEPCIIAWREL
ncbi:MAG: general secretion pathway protein GspK [Candidatus Omnitrophica bacterium]|nr:general secretion pathway protein GspK [Candidatus Omnitrophota bacterium]